MLVRARSSLVQGRKLKLKVNVGSGKSYFDFKSVIQARSTRVQHVLPHLVDVHVIPAQGAVLRVDVVDAAHLTPGPRSLVNSTLRRFCHRCVNDTAHLIRRKVLRLS